MDLGCTEINRASHMGHSFRDFGPSNPNPKGTNPIEVRLKGASGNEQKLHLRMALPTLSSIVSVKSLRRRLPLVGAFCVISLGLSNLSPPLSLSSKPCWAQSLPFSAFVRSKFSSQTAAKGIHTVRMEAASSNKTVPSIVVYVTVPNKEAGKKLAQSIVKEKLAACVNRVPGIESVYQGQGKIETDSEELLIIKTRESLLEALTAHVKANHEYEVPEVIALPITGGNLQYLEWIKNSTKG